MKDLIERQAAIDAVLGACKDTATTECAVRELEELPSAQPDTRLKKIADLVDGSIDHFDLEDAMDLLYQIKEVLK